MESGKSYNAPQNLLKAVIEEMKRERKLNKRIIEVAKNRKNIGVLGVTYKANTDVREAPSLSIIPDLINKGFNVSIYDPQASRDGIKEFEEVIGSLTYSVAKKSTV